jgi:hypothetical protein
MEEDQERDSPSDEEREIIEDEDMEDSATDIPELWIPDRNDEDTKFVRGQGHPIPTKKYPQTTSEVSIVQDRKKFFKNLVKGGMETQTSSVADKYLRDAGRDAIWERNTVTFPNGKQFHNNHKWLDRIHRCRTDMVWYWSCSCLRCHVRHWSRLQKGF